MFQRPNRLGALLTNEKRCQRPRLFCSAHRGGGERPGALAQPIFANILKETITEQDLCKHNVVQYSIIILLLVDCGTEVEVIYSAQFLKPINHVVFLGPIMLIYYYSFSTLF